MGIDHSVAGPLCTRILCELGADVIKVERPGGGDFARHWDGNVRGDGAQFWWLNRAKRSIVLDLKEPADRSALDALLERADVFVHNLAPASAVRLGLDARAVGARFSRLVNCQISGYGADGPASGRKAYDMLIQAEAGVMSLTGTEDQPTRVGVSISDVTTGIYSALLVLAALREREHSGRGRHLDVAMFDVTLEFLGPMLTSYLNAGVMYPRIPDQHHAIAPYGAFTCSDGQRIMIAIEQNAEWTRFCRDVLGDAALAAEPRYATNVARIQRREELHSLLSERIARRHSGELAQAMAEAELAYGRVNDVSQVLEHEVAAHRRIVATGRTRDGDTVRWPSGIVERLLGRIHEGSHPPPALGEHTATVLREWSP